MDGFWNFADRFVSTDPPPVDIAAHRLELVVAESLRKQGLEVPVELVDVERSAALIALAAPAVLAQIRKAWDGKILLLKGPEVAAHYPSPRLRGYGDLDILVDDADGLYRTLERIGFVPVGNPKLFEDIHHLRPLALPGLAVPVEIHTRVKWLDGFEPPDVGRLLAESIPSATQFPGVDAPSSAYHVLVLAAHSWAHEPFRRLRDVLDIACVRAASDDGEVERLARDLGVARLWSATSAVVDAVLDGRPLPRPIRLWARNLEEYRERTVFEAHLEEWLSGFAIQPPLAAIAGWGGTLKGTLLPDDEPPLQKLKRSYRAMRNARRRRSEHETEVADLRPPPFGDR